MLVLALAGATACAAGKSVRIETAESSGEVANLLRATWGVSTGFPSFSYSCVRLDKRGRWFTCRALDAFRIVRLASFDVQCDGSNCRWQAYPAYVG